MGLFKKMCKYDNVNPCKNDDNNYNADGIIENILRTGKAPNISNLSKAKGHKITINKNTFNKLMKSIQMSAQKCNESKNEIHVLQNKIQELELEMKDMVCFSEICTSQKNGDLVF